VNALRRIVAVARATARDLFAGHGGAILLLALLAATVALFSARGTTDVELRAVALRERTGGAAAIALLAVMLAAAHAVADDRRVRRLPQLLATPLRPFEYLLAKFGGVFVGLALPLAAIHVALVALPDAGVLRHPEQFAPRHALVATTVVRTRADGRAELWKRGSGAVLKEGERLAWRFPAPPAAGPLELELSLRALPSDEPDEPGGEAPPPPPPPPLVALELDGKPLLDHRALTSYAETTLRVPLPSQVGAHQIVLRVVTPEAKVRVDPAACRLLGARGSPLASVLRAGCGVALLLFFGGALAAAFAVVLPDVIALLLTAVIALLGFLRPLLVDVAATVADDVEHAARATRELATLLGKVLQVVPDLSALVAGDRLATAAPPFAAGDALLHAWPAVFGIAALAVAALGLRGAQRRGLGGGA
jgi:hypothetical protein